MLIVRRKSILKSYLKRLNECPEQNSDGVALSQQFDQPSRSEESQESDVDKIFLKLEKNKIKFQRSDSEVCFDTC